MRAVVRLARGLTGGLLRAGGVSGVTQRSLMTPHDQLVGGVKQLDAARALPGVLDNCFLTYVWIDGTGETMRAKQQTVAKEPKSIADVKDWGFDGSSTGQAVGHDSDMILKPVAMCRDPFFPGPSKIVMCEVYDKDGKPDPKNFRAECMSLLEEVKAEDPWFGMEQEYTMLGSDSRPVGFPKDGGFPGPQGPYYCATGAGRTVGRELCDAHYLACTWAGLTINGTNAEVLLGQWEYQIGPCPGIAVADELWLARYIMERMSEEVGVRVSLDPKPVLGDWNGTGNHANFSSKKMREEGGLKYIQEAIERLSRRHESHIAAYDPNNGEDNKRRLTGDHETASIHEFSADAGSRAVSVRIPRAVALAGKGWLEDRRPSGNCDPYQVVARMLKTICLDRD